KGGGVARPWEAVSTRAIVLGRRLSVSLRNWFAGLVGSGPRASGANRRRRGVRPGRRLELEPLEERACPALGDLLHALPNPLPVVSDIFGVSVAVSGNRVLVGAPSSQATGADGVGAAYLLDATSGARLQTFTAPMPAFNDTFGSSVALAGNLVAVGAVNG